MLGAYHLETIKDKDGLYFIFKKQGFGKTFEVDMELVSVINELYNATKTPFSLAIENITLEKLDRENTYTTLVSLKKPFKASMLYGFTNNTCFDGGKDFCAITGD